MREIGIREAKARLSQVLHDVQGGAEWTITHHGRPVARIVPVDTRTLTLAQRLQILADRGVIEPPGESAGLKPSSPLRLAEAGLAQRLLQEERDAGR